MEMIIKLLAERNHHLLKFKEINERELENFSEGNFDNLETFYQSRETILDLVRTIEGMINEELSQLNPNSKDIMDVCRKSVVEAMDVKNQIVTEILSQDLQILASIESEKSTIIKDLRQVQTTKKAFNSYQSKGQSNSVNEEA
ncbi:MAG: hypothetical protein CL676_06700 [Bdellovibrionaceae bacterium]|nr:hypothetical protein [Pseudobdellovibrionaceae bacterium]